MALFISIITATRNAQDALPHLLDSLAVQTFRDFELVVQDCVSTDATKTILHSTMPMLPCVSYASEEDTGIYDAWNKALQRASGEWILFLGADDCLHSPSSLQEAVNELVCLSGAIEFFATSLVLTLPNGYVLEEWHPSKKPLADLPSCMPLPHPALFYRTRLFVNRKFTTSLRIAGDYDFICQTLNAHNVCTSSLVTSHMSVGGISGSLNSMLQSELECLRVSHKYFPHARPWKLYARICRSAMYQVISRFAGEKTGHVFADTLRMMQGKTPLWQRMAAPHCACASIPQMPHITLIVTVISRTDPLERLLQSLKQQYYTKFSIVIVDQNAQGELDCLLKSFTSLTLTHVYCSPSGVSRARNVGLQYAKGDIIVFPDDDCWYEPNTLAAAVDFFREYPSCAALLGSWVESAKQYPPATSTVPLTRYSAFAGSETYVQFYRREVVQAVGDFDTTLGPGTGLPWGCGEDTDYVLRAIARNFCVKRAPSVKVHHPRPALSAPLEPHLLQKYTNYALGRMYLLRKHTFPLWFKLANVMYPMWRALVEGPRSWPYRWAMFKGRLRGLFL